MSVWDHDLDAAEAATLLEATAVIEQYRAVREPLPFDDPRRLLDRLRTIATLSRDDAVHWRLEADDRREEAAADGGRWGSPGAAARMAAIADDTARVCGELGEVAHVAAEDLSARLRDLGPVGPVGPVEAGHRAEQGARQLLGELGVAPDGDR